MPASPAPWRLYFWQDGPARLLVFAVLYAAGEWLRGHLLTGFPWNLPAYGWGASLAILQCMSLFGAYGLSFLTILLGASLAGLRQAKRLESARWRCWRCSRLLWAGGAVRLAAHPTQSVADVRLRIVQPDIPQREKDQFRAISAATGSACSISARCRPAQGNPTHIIWPEAAPPPLLFDRAPSRWTKSAC